MMNMNNMNNMGMNMGMNNFQLIQNNFNNMNQIQGMNNNQNLMNMPMMNDMQKDITNIQEANIIIKQLIRQNIYFINQNIYLNNKINELETKMKNFEQYKNKMDLNCYYNQFDVKAYKLNDIFCKLESKENIKKEDEFGLINKAIRHLFNKNINNFIFVYKFKEDEFEPVVFKQLFNDLTYSVLIISIQEQNNKRRFGAFIHKNMNNIKGNTNTNNMNNMNMNMMNLNPLPNNNNMMNLNPLSNNNNMMNVNLLPSNNNMMNVNPIPSNNNMMNLNPLLSNNNMTMNQNQTNSTNQTVGQNNSMMNMMMNQNRANFNNPMNLEIENIFNSYSNPSNSFVFSLDSLNIYYKEDINKYYPGFSITYNKKCKRLLGEEIQNSGEPEPYKLSGKKEFIIESLELYEIKI